MRTKSLICCMAFMLLCSVIFVSPVFSMTKVRSNVQEESSALNDVDFLKIEKRVREMMERAEFLTPTLFWQDKGSEPDERYLDRSFSAFVVTHREREFLLTAAHVVSDHPLRERIFFCAVIRG